MEVFLLTLESLTVSALRAHRLSIMLWTVV
nr:MAG TPA: Quorum-sensing antiactivator helix coiled coil, SIGNALING.1A [Caudoviricetes sp.]